MRTLRLVRPLVVAVAMAIGLAWAGDRAPVAGQFQLKPIADQQGEVGLELMLRRLGSIGTFMMTTAHPDDENNALLAQLHYGDGHRTALVTATHGEGGQNEIGPELFEALATLRTEELAAAHRFDGAEQYFARAVDFGYSFSVEETFDRWGKDEIVADFVRLVRTIRPDVIVGFIWDGAGGGQHHQATARLTAEAFRAAADPAKFPEQIAEGLRPWQAKKHYYTVAFGFGPQASREPDPKWLMTDGGVHDALLGRTWNEIGAEARSMHKCQGMSQLLPLPGPARRPYRLQDTVLPDGVDRAESSMFDGIDTGFRSLTKFAGPSVPVAFESQVNLIAGYIEGARSDLRAHGLGSAAAPLVQGLTALRELRRSLPSMGLGDDARFEIDFRLAQKEEQFEQAVLIAYGVRVDAVADDDLVTRGQPLAVNLVVGNRGHADLVVKRAAVSGLQGETAACAAGAVRSQGTFACKASGAVPADARLTSIHFTRRADIDRYDFDPDVPFGLPFRPTPFVAHFEFEVESGAVVSVSRPVQSRSQRDIFAGEKRAEIKVVPALAVRVSPEITVVPSGAPQVQPTSTARTREVRVTVTNGTKGAASADVALTLPEGWTASPASIPVSFTREDEEVTVRFTLTAPPRPTVGSYSIRASARMNGEAFDQGYQVVEYPHTARRHLVRPAEANLKVIDVQTAPNLTVGYIMGVGDLVPPALEQLGARVVFIENDELAWGDLSRYDVIMTGVRAYERRADLRAYNQRLLDYAANGGTVIVNYNKFEFNEAQYGPFPGKVGRDRVTDETAPVRVLVADHPVFNTPNRLTDAVWQGWVQERGLYFLGERDERYVDLVETEDPFPFNKGPKRGALVEARVGQGRWFYVGLGLWRQLPAGTDGAYQLMANLISLGKTGSTGRSVAGG
jgi:LmbE family N-acetylglucosaminyl deacetylase